MITTKEHVELVPITKSVEDVELEPLPIQETT